VTLAWLLIAALAVWITLAPLDEVIRGVGRIIPEAKTQTIQHLEGGIIDAILVHEGEVVVKGTPLFRIHDQGARTARDEQAIGRKALELKRTRLEAEMKGVAPVFDDADRQTNPDLVQNEQQVFATRRDDYRRQLEILSEQQRQKKLQADDSMMQVSKLKLELGTASQQLAINQKLRASGALSESRMLETQSQVQQLETRISTAQGQVPVLRAALSELSKRQSQITEERQSKIADELSTVNVQLQQYEEREKSLGDRLTRTSVVAPASGVINRIMVTTVGGVVQPGAALAELTPTEGTLLVEGKIGARDRARVWNGQPVTVRVSAYDYASYGSLEGRVRDISADSLKDEQGNAFYRVVITLAHANMQGKALVPGMTADFYVKGERHSALWQITLPLRKLFFY
jgi:adhesin transport system membrane fusion protein